SGAPSPGGTNRQTASRAERGRRAREGTLVASGCARRDSKGTPMHWQLLAAFLVVAAPAPPEKDEETFQGTWTVVSMEYGGKKTPGDELKSARMTVKGNQITITNGKTDEQMTFTLDPAMKPKTIDLLVKREVGKDLPIPGIYELKDDELKICFAKA